MGRGTGSWVGIWAWAGLASRRRLLSTANIERDARISSADDKTRAPHPFIPRVLLSYLAAANQVPPSGPVSPSPLYP